MLRKNAWFQLGTVIVIICGGLLIYDFGPGIYSSLMAAKSPPPQQAPAPSTPPSTPPAPTPPAPTPAQPANTDKPDPRGGLMVNTNPEGATVALGGEDVQTSPATFKGVKPGSYPIHIKMDGYEPVDESAEIKDNQFTDLGVITLVRSTGSLQITTDPAGLVFSVSQNGTVVNSGQTPATVSNLVVGDYDVSVKKRLWTYKNTSPITIVRNKTIVYSPAIETGSIDITSDPSGLHYSIGQNGTTISTGTTPATESDLPTGVYDVSVQNNNWEMKSTVSVERNGSASYAPKFITGSVSVNSTPSGATVFCDGKELGKTPLRVDKLQPGAYTFSLSLSGYAPGSASADITPNGVATTSTILEKYELSGRWTGTVLMTGKDYDTGEPIRTDAPIEIKISRDATSLTIKSGANPSCDVTEVKREGNTLKWTWKLPDPGTDWLAYCTLRMTDTRDAAFIQDLTFVTGQATGYNLHLEGTLKKQ